MKNYRLNKDDTVLIVIDFQEKLMKAMSKSEKVYKNTNLLLAAAEQMGIPVIVTEQYPKGLGATANEIKDNLKEYQYVDKMEFSAYSGLKQILSDAGRKTLLITGSETHVCVFQTTRDLLEDGYNVHVVKDAVCSRFKENYLNGLELMKDMGAVISNTETILFDLLKVAGSPEFKVISPMLK
ncbi:MAG: hydrolase [Firmicutes bacterium HGW-Firmicutes-15]|nr:MAG: hydrolase [Firmicutes bacterium HGW-Firmicutes-15]